jgi:hemerythrin-like domain-containing protein
MMENIGNRPRPVELFMADHEAVRAKLDRLDQLFSRLEADASSLGEADTTFFREMTTLFDTELVVHFEREEKALFPAMEKYVPRDMGPIGVMLEEHVKVFDTIDKFKKGVESLGGSGGPSVEMLEELMFNGRSIIELLRSHIEKENEVLLPMAESHLNDAEWDQVWEAMEEITLETIR